MYYLRYLCLFSDSGVQHIYRFVFVLFVFVYVACVSGLSNLYCPVGILMYINKQPCLLLFY
jgi:hypothetical protein